MPETLHERLADIAQEDKQFVAVAMEQAKFEALKDTQAWVALERHIGTITERAVQSIATEILAGRDVEPTELARLRGYIQGMRAVVEFPKYIDADFDRQVERAWRKALAQAALSGDNEQEDDQHGIST